MDPGPLTLRELLWMVEGFVQERWNHTAAVLAMLVNTHRDPKKGRPAKPADFHPGPKRKTEVISQQEWAAFGRQLMTSVPDKSQPKARMTCTQKTK